MSFLKSNLSMPISAGTSTSNSATIQNEEAYAMSRLISNIMDAMTPPSTFTSTPTGYGSSSNSTASNLAPGAPTSSRNAMSSPSASGTDWSRAIVSTSASPPQNPIGTVSRPDYAQSNNNHHREETNSSPGTSSSTVSLTCARCDERAPTTRCLECNEIFCSECCHGISTECQIKEHTRIPYQQISPIGMKMISTRNCITGEREYKCETHSEMVKYICESCTQLACQECTLWIHKDHLCIPIRGSFESCRLQMMKALDSGKTGTKAIKGAIDRAVSISKCYEKDSVEVSMKIRRTIRYFVQALETREKELLDKVEKIKQMKLNELCDQMNTLRGILAGLAHTNECIVKSMDLEGLELFLVKEKRMAEIEYYATMYKSLQPKDDNIIFMPPNLDFSEQIKCQGDVMLASIAPGQGMRSLQNSSASGNSDSRQNMYGMNPNMPGQCYDSLPQRGYGQGILGYAFPITVKYSINPAQSGLPLLSFAPEGPDEGEVSRPWGLCVNKEGNILVADRRNNRIQIFNRNGEFQTTFGTKGTGPGEFDLPAGITTDSCGRIVVIDKDNHRVQIFTASGEFLFMFGTFGKECGQFQYPWDVAVNSLGNIAVTDTRNHRVQLFTNRGTFITKFVFEGVNPTKHLKGPTTPRGICFTTNGNIIISDFENHRLLMVDASMNRIITAIGREGCGVNELNRPSGLVTDDEGRIVVADSKNHRVVVLSPDLRYEWSVNLKSPGLDDKDRPSDVALTPEGHVIVLFETLPDTAREVISHGKEYIKMY